MNLPRPKKPWWFRIAFPMMAWVLLGAFPIAGAAEVGVRASAELGAVRDDMVVPLGFGGGGLRIGASLTARVGEGRLDALLDLAGARYLVERYGHPAQVYDYGLDLRWTRGFGLAFVVESHMELLESWDGSYGYWLGAEWVGPAFRHEFRGADGRVLAFDAAVAVAGFVSRPSESRTYLQDPTPHLSFYYSPPFTDPRFRTLPDFVSARAALSVARQESAWHFGIETRFARCSEPVPIVDIVLAPWLEWRLP